MKFPEPLDQVPGAENRRNPRWLPPAFLTLTAIVVLAGCASDGSHGGSSGNPGPYQRGGGPGPNQRGSSGNGR